MQLVFSQNLKKFSFHRLTCLSTSILEILLPRTFLRPANLYQDEVALSHGTFSLLPRKHFRIRLHASFQWELSALPLTVNPMPLFELGWWTGWYFVLQRHYYMHFIANYMYLITFYSVLSRWWRSRINLNIGYFMVWTVTLAKYWNLIAERY